jgi:hypothetical protein
MRHNNEDIGRFTHNIFISVSTDFGPVFAARCGRVALAVIRQRIEAAEHAALPPRRSPKVCALSFPALKGRGLTRFLVKKAAGYGKLLIQADVWATRNRLCTELSTEMGEQSIGERQVWSAASMYFKWMSIPRWLVRRVTSELNQRRVVRGLF